MYVRMFTAGVAGAAGHALDPLHVVAVRALTGYTSIFERGGYGAGGAPAALFCMPHSPVQPFGDVSPGRGVAGDLA